MIILTLATTDDHRRPLRLLDQYGIQYDHWRGDAMSDGNWGSAWTPPLWTLGGLGLGAALTAGGIVASPLGLGVAGAIIDLLTANRDAAAPYPVCQVLTIRLRNTRDAWAEYILLRAGYSPSNGLTDARNAIWAANHSGPPPSWREQRRQQRRNRS